MLVTNLCMRRCPLPFSGTSEPIRSYFKWLDSMTSTNFARRASNLHHQTDEPPLGCRTQSSAQRVGQCPPTRVQIGRHYVPNLFVVDSLFEIAAYNAVALLIRIPPYTRVFRSGLVFSASGQCLSLSWWEFDCGEFPLLEMHRKKVRYIIEKSHKTRNAI